MNGVFRFRGEIGRHVISVLISFIVACSPSGNASGEENESLESVSLVQLLATPELFRDKRLITYGFAILRFEGNALYLSKDDGEYLIVANSLWLDLEGANIGDIDQRQLNRKYVLVQGVFDPSKRGHMSLRPGTITRIERIELLEREQ